ncbi:hypothetical protein [Rhodococcoides fascians]|uniref:hypothetical protein n=1 Tax=Rhodococcoides fascians TaxID=1828 RepID=UPI000559FF08|nr:hypothetical protein [Rhodococcus fascians]
MGEREPAEVAGVSESVLDELAHTLTEKLDILLDRLTDRALAVPDTGTAAWHTHWQDRDSESGRQLHARRLYVRAVLASRAGIGLVASTEPPTPDVDLHRVKRPGSRRPRVDANQLSIF